MKPQYSKRRNQVFTIVSVVAVIINLCCAFLNYVVWSEGLLGSELYERMVNSAAGLELTAILVGVLGFLGTGFAYFLSFDPYRAKRPVPRLFVLLFSFGLFVAAYFLGVYAVAPDNVGVIAAGAAGAAILPFVVMGIERMLGAILLKMARSVTTGKNPGSALRLARSGLRFKPANAEGEISYGLALAARGNADQALPYLEDAYAQGRRNPEILQALSDLYEKVSNTDRTIEMVENLQEVRPSEGNYNRLIDLYRKAGRNDSVLAELQKLSPEDQEPWLDLIIELLVEKKDAPGLRLICERLEDDGAPYTRARECYHKLLNFEEHSVSSWKKLAHLVEKSGDAAATVEMLEHVLTLEPEDSVTRRKLIDYYRRHERTADRFRHLHLLLKYGAALDEKMEVFERYFSEGDYRKLHEMASADSELSQQGRVAALLARADYESGDTASALKLSTRARKLGVDQKTQSDLTSMETSIRTRETQTRLSELAQQATENPHDLEVKFAYLDFLVGTGGVEKAVVEMDELLTRGIATQVRIESEIEKMLRNHGRSFRLMSYLADLYLREEKLDRVHELSMQMAEESLNPVATRREAIEKILRANPQHIPALLTAIDLEYAAGKHKEVLHYLDRYLEAGGTGFPHLRDIEFESAVTLGDLARSEPIGLQLLEEQTSRNDILLRLADLHLAGNAFDSGLALLRRAAAQDPDNVNLRRQIKATEEKKKRARMAELQSVLATNGENRVLQEELGDIAHDFGLLNEAIVAYQKAGLGDASRNIPRAKLGYILAKKGLHADAEESLNEAQLTIEQAPEEQSSLKALFYSTGELMEKDDQFERALQLYKRIFRVDAGYRDVVNKIEILQRTDKKKR